MQLCLVATKAKLIVLEILNDLFYKLGEFFCYSWMVSQVFKRGSLPFSVVMSMFQKS